MWVCSWYVVAMLLVYADDVPTPGIAGMGRRAIWALPTRQMSVNLDSAMAIATNIACQTNLNMV